MPTILEVNCNIFVFIILSADFISISIERKEKKRTEKERKEKRKEKKEKEKEKEKEKRNKTTCFTMMNSVVTGSVQYVLERTDGSHQLRVNPELIYQVELNVDMKY